MSADTGKERGLPERAWINDQMNEDREPVVSADTEALIATVREALKDSAGCSHCRGSLKGLAALDSLAAELERLRGEREWIAERHGQQADRANRTEAELERVKVERDLARSAHNDTLDRYERLDARLDKALAALREIADMPPTNQWYRDTARAALAEIEGEA